MAPRVLLPPHLQLGFPASAISRLEARRASQQQGRPETAALDIPILLKLVLSLRVQDLLHSRFPPVHSLSHLAREQLPSRFQLGVLLASAPHLRLLQRSPPLCSASEVEFSVSDDLSAKLTLAAKLLWNTSRVSRLERCPAFMTIIFWGIYWAVCFPVPS
jgi:hypothetical protein